MLLFGKSKCLSCTGCSRGRGRTLPGCQIQFTSKLSSDQLLQPGSGGPGNSAATFSVFVPAASLNISTIGDPFSGIHIIIPMPLNGDDKSSFILSISYGGSLSIFPLSNNSLYLSWQAIFSPLQKDRPWCEPLNTQQSTNLIWYRICLA